MPTAIESTLPGRETARESRRARLTPILLLVSGLVLGICGATFWIEDARTSRGHEELIPKLATLLELRLETHRAALEGLFTPGEPDPETFLRATEPLLAAYEELDRIAWVDTSGIPRLVEPHERHRQILGFEIEPASSIAAWRTSNERATVVASRIYELVAGEGHFLDLWIARRTDGEIRGHLVATLRCERLLARLLKGSEDLVHARLRDDANGRVTSSGDPEDGLADEDWRLATILDEPTGLSLDARLIHRDTGSQTALLPPCIAALVLSALALWRGHRGRRRETTFRQSASRDREELAILRDAIASLDVGVILVDHEGDLLASNPAAQELIGTPGRVPLGEWPARLGLFRATRRRTACQPEELPVLAALRGETSRDVQVFLRNEHRPEGCLLRLCAAPLRDADRNIVGASVSMAPVEEDDATRGDVNARWREIAASQKARNELLVRMSHDIRSPISSVVQCAEALVSDSLGADERAELTRELESNADSILALIDDLLIFAQLEAGDVRPEPVRCSPFVILDEATREARSLAAEKGLEVELAYYGSMPETIETDPARLRQIVERLLLNVIEATESGVVRVSCNLLGAFASYQSFFCIEVVDADLGMSADQLGRLFEAFSEAHAPTVRRFGDTGLRLAVAKRLAQLLGGDIFAQQAPTGKSLIARVETGPLDGVALLERPPADLACPFERAGASRDSVAGCRILVADDNRVNRSIIERLLARAGAVVETCPDGRSALDLHRARALESAPHDVCVLDVQMPEIDGLETAARLRGAGFRGPLIALAASSLDIDRKRALAAGFDAYLSKPVDRNELISTIASLRSGQEIPRPLALVDIEAERVPDEIAENLTEDRS